MCPDQITRDFAASQNALSSGLEVYSKIHKPREPGHAKAVSLSGVICGTDNKNKDKKDAVFSIISTIPTSYHNSNH